MRRVEKQQDSGFNRFLQLTLAVPFQNILLLIRLFLFVFVELPRFRALLQVFTGKVKHDRVL